MSFYNYSEDKEVVDEVKRKLGFPVVKVEIDDSQWRDIIKATKRWFLSKKSIVSMKYMTISSSHAPVPFSDIDPVNGVYKIIDVYPDETTVGFKGEDTTYYDILPFGYPIWGSSTYAFGSQVYNRTSFIYQIFQSLEKRRRVYGVDKDWFVLLDDVNGHKLQLTPNRRGGNIAIIYKPAILPVEALKGKDAELFYLYALATAKETLGRIRSKYGDYPAAGGNIATDGKDLLEEAKTEKEYLEEAIAGSQGPMGVLFA